MKHSYSNPRPLATGMGEAVARRTVLRKFNLDGTPHEMDNRPIKWEEWQQVANRVATGNVQIKSKGLKKDEFSRFRDHIANASILMSGRHLQHGDATQPTRNMEVFVNCATAASTFSKYYLLLNGAGVGRCYDDDMMVVDWAKQPFVHCVINEKHPDYDYRIHESLEQAMHKYGKEVIVFKVPDSREGWGKAVEYLESITFKGDYHEKIILFDFSLVRPKGALIGGMQKRPSSGPVPLMNAINAINTLKGTLIPKWKQAMYVDHYLAESVLVGGARRAARIAVKFWRDPGILEYIRLKSVSFNGSAPLWTANNSIGVDEDFWNDVQKKPESWARIVFDTVCDANWNDDTGEPAFLNLHKLNNNPKGAYTAFDNGDYCDSKKYSADHGRDLLRYVAKIMKGKKHWMIVNPCGEICLNILTGFCVIGDVVPFHCDNQEEFNEAVRLTARALVRTNLMDSIYNVEVRRTNRIGVSLTGIHEYAWKAFKLTFKDLIDERKSRSFWMSLSEAKRNILDEIKKYCTKLGVVIPHTDTTIKPAGTTSKLFALTEGAHLPSMKEFLRWVQFRSDDPLVEKYRREGYPTIDLKSYTGTTVVGFPTQPEICRLGLGKELITASEATPEEQFKWLMLLEKYWIVGVDEDGVPLARDTGNQVSYTLKYDHEKMTIESFKEMILKYTPQIRCCSIMPKKDATAYEYQPEQPISLEEYDKYVNAIKREIEEDVDKVHIDCATGACPIDFDKETKN
jgi:adenosylcobalamin-dependent ribonucleoside-triphosphate reductase